ncbi:Cytochrome protein [Ophiophagus hannah]|uniref:Cytochrome protein n=1 Tax=Ophiophagus hannah TaxID=8665 RepID=V8N353_OPHHA|nr:Cytochrome protein [Ophiophagus hannah]
MVQIAVDLLIGGAETSTTTLYWGLLYLLKYPDVQDYPTRTPCCMKLFATAMSRSRGPYGNA